MKQPIKLILFVLLLLNIIACATTKQGIIVNSVVKPELDITVVSQLMGDDMFDHIAICKVTDPERRIPDPKVLFTIDKVLKEELTKVLSYNIKDYRPGKRIPLIKPSVSGFVVKGPVFQDGYYVIKGESIINFSLERSDGTIVRSIVESANVYDKNPSKQFLNKNSLMIQMAKKTCKKFVRRFVPSKRREFRELVQGDDTVNKGIVAATNGNLEGAEMLFEHAIKADKTNAPAYYNLGVVLEGQKENFQQSLKMYKQAFMLDPGNPLYNKNYVRLKNNLKGTTYLKDIKGTVGESERSRMK
jgi:tetratricopeptide (TPR) repeat protein